MTSLDKPTTEDTSADDARAVTEAALFEAFGGVRGMVETVLPGLLFVSIYTINKNLHMAAIAALAVSLAMVVVRLARKDTVKHAFSGVFGVGFGVVFAMMTGNAKDFYLPGMLYTTGLALAYIITAMAGVPLIGLMLGPIFRRTSPGAPATRAAKGLHQGQLGLGADPARQERDPVPAVLVGGHGAAGLGPGRAEDPAVPARGVPDVGVPGEGAAADRRVRGDGGGGARRGGAQGRARTGEGAARGGRRGDDDGPAPPTLSHLVPQVST